MAVIRLSNAALRRVRGLYRGLALCVLLVLALSLALPQRSVRADPIPVNIWITTSNTGGVVQGLQPQTPVSFTADVPNANPVIRVDDTKTFQVWEGGGASFTDGAAWLINQKLSPTLRDQVMRNLFDPVNGIGVSFLRNPMGSSDLTRETYNYDNNANDRSDPSLPSFSIDHDRMDVLPLTKWARQLNPKLTLMMNAWSPPGWMKSSGSMNSGSILAQYYPHYTTYYVKTIKAYEAEGVHVNYVSLNNEPTCCGSQSYPQVTVMSPSDMSTILKNHWFPAWQQNNLTTKILLLDYNWCNASVVQPIMGDTSITRSPYIGGVAWHGYCQSPTIMSSWHATYGVDNFLTERSGFNDGSAQQKQDFQDIISTTRNWGKSVVKWPVAADENNGPHIGGCGTCHGLVRVHVADGRAGQVDYGIEYYTMGHVTKFVSNGAYRVDSSDNGQLLNVAFKNPDGSIALIAYNNGAGAYTFKVAWGTQAFNYTLPAGAGATFKWGGEPLATPTTGPSPTPQPPTATPVPGTTRIEAGGTAAFTDSAGNLWAADNSFVGGNVVDRGNIAIANTVDDKLYQTERYGMTGYAIPTANGSYTVKLHFAETYAGTTAAGQRVFTVNVEGTPIANLDIFAQVGKNAALVKSVTVTVSDGVLNLGFTASAGNAIINGIELIPTAVPPTVTNTSLPPTITNTPIPPTITNTALPLTVTKTSLPPTVTNTALPPTLPPAVAIRVEAGSNAAFTDNTGKVWAADNSFTGGGIVDRGAIAIANTVDDKIYQTERYGLTGYAFNVPNGSYTVRLHFAETYAGITGAGQRVFNATVEGSALNNLDIFATVGKNAAMVKEVNVTVSDGVLNIGFTALKNNALINGIEITGGSLPPTAVPTTAVPPTAVPTTAVPPTAVPTTAVPPTTVPTTAVPPTAVPTTAVPTTAVPPTAIPPASAIRIEAGGTAAFTDSAGNLWAADNGFTGGSVVDRGAIAIANTNDDRIYQTERYGLTGYTIPVPNGTYGVRLHFAETYAGTTAAGQRVFNVNVEGSALNNLDIFAEAGKNAALVKPFTVTVSDGTLNIAFTALKGNAIINGIEIFGGNLPTVTPVPPTTTPAPVVAGRISPLLVGNNVWLNPSEAVWNASKGASLKIIRIGGIGYDNTLPSNDQLTIWVNKIKSLGAEPLIQVSQYKSATDAANLVRYFNVTTGNTVKYWNIGNEPWIERGRPADHSALAKTVAGYVKPIASAMKTVDPSIKIFAPDECDYFEDMYNELLGGSADITGKDANGRWYVDGISWHRYPINTAPADLATSGAQDFLVRMQAIHSRLAYANTLQGRTGGDALQWGIGEFNARDGVGVCTFNNGQMFGQIYGYAMKYGATYAATWDMYEADGSCTGTDFSFVNKDMTPRSSYYHMQMVSNNFSGVYADGSSNLANVRAYGAVDTNKIAVMLLNVGAAAQSCNLRLNNDATSGSCAVNIAANLPVTVSQPIAAQTTMVLVFNGQGQLARRITYTNGSTPKEEILIP